MGKLKEYICKQCKKQYFSRDYRTKFCSRSCATKYNSTGRKLSEETKTKLVAASIKFWKEHPELKSKKEKESQKGKHKRCPKNLFELSKRTISKIITRLKIPCSNCGFDKVSGDLHHIVPRHLGGTDDHFNLAHLCPNCHRLADRGLLTKFITLEEQIGDRWKQYYYG